MTWQKSTQHPRVDQTASPWSCVKEEPGYIHTHTHSHTRKTSPPRYFPLTHDHHSCHTQIQGPRWHSQRRGGEKETVALSRDFVNLSLSWISNKKNNKKPPEARVFLFFALTFPSPPPPSLPRSKDELQEKVQAGDFQVRTVPVQAHHGHAQHR